MRSSFLRGGIAGLLAIAVVGLVGWQAGWFDGLRAEEPQIPGVIREAPLGGPFTLTSSNGDTVTEKNLDGKLTLMFFGYRFCPDFCPNELQKFTEVMDKLGPDADKVQVWFVSIDPERDKPADLKEYVGLFDPRFMGLTGTPEQVAAAAKAWRVYYAKADAEDSSDYLMDHSTFSYLMGKDGKNRRGVQLRDDAGDDDEGDRTGTVGA